MSTWRRALLYVARKRARSLLLFLILLFMGLSMLVGISMRNSAAKAAEEVRRSLKTGITLQLKAVTGDDVFDKITNEKGETLLNIKVPLLTRSKLKQLLDLEGIEGFYCGKSYRTLHTGLEVHPGFYTQSYKDIFEKGIEEKDPDKDLAYYETPCHVNSFYIIEDGRWHPFFANGALTLTQGRHIEIGDVGKAVISEELAERNGLKIGDKIEARNFDVLSGEPYGNSYQSEIVGVYQINFEQSLSKWTTEENILANVIFSDPELDYWSQVEYNTHYGRDVLARENAEHIGNVTLFVEDPLQLGEVTEQIRAFDAVDWSFYDFETYDDDYQAAAGPLILMINLSTGLALGMAAGILIILWLLLTMWMRSRRREIGILISIGGKRRTALGQILLECLLIAVPALLIAIAGAKPVTEVTGNALAGMVSPSDGRKSYEVKMENNFSDLEINKMPAEQVSLEYDVTVGTVIIVFFSMLAVIFAAVTIPFRRYVIRKPRDILESQA